MIAADIDAAVRAVCPIHGVSVGDVAHRSTWRIDFKDEATAEQRAEAQAVLVAFSIPPISVNAEIDAQIRAIEFRELAPRFNREATLVMLAKFYMAEKSVDFATAVSQMTTVGHAGYNSGFTKLKALDDQIRVLRAQRLP